MNKNLIVLAGLFFASCATMKKHNTQQNYTDPHRPQIHFSPKKGWMNDPNGMVFLNGTYHLFFQHYPDGTVWGPMHWGHATSKDLVHWQEEPIALYPDDLGMIFSGSAVIDKNNTAGFGKNAMVAIFTHHSPEIEKTGSDKYQNQSIAYSIDEGKTWTKYTGNPVLKNPGIKDFRDPKVFWYEPGKKWVMTLATLDHITFCSSPDLKTWAKESEFGKNLGAHGGVWECPDLFSLNDHNKQVWILIVNLNPGGPNGGSATQYFMGDFDGNTFRPFDSETHWLDYGPDEYAGITWGNTGNRKIFYGWMSNWEYANVVPTEKWRSAMTIARELSLEKIGNKLFVASQPVNELGIIAEKGIPVENLKATDYTLDRKIGNFRAPGMLRISSDKIKPFTITLSNDVGEKLILGFDREHNNYFIDRTQSGKVAFEKGFAAIHRAPRLSTKENMDLTLIIDCASVELFADGGLSVMTSIFFPSKSYNHISIQSADGLIIKSLKYHNLKSIWE